MVIIRRACAMILRLKLRVLSEAGIAMVCDKNRSLRYLLLKFAKGLIFDI